MKTPTSLVRASVAALVLAWASSAFLEEKENHLRSGLFVYTTSSGDDRIDPTDRYFINFGPGTVIGGPVGTMSRLPDLAGSDFDTSFDLAWRNLVVPGNGRLVLMHFGIGAADVVEALALAQSLTDLSHPKALIGLDPALRPSIINFEIP